MRTNKRVFQPLDGTMSVSADETSKEHRKNRNRRYDKDDVYPRTPEYAPDEMRRMAKIICRVKIKNFRKQKQLTNQSTENIKKL